MGKGFPFRFRTAALAALLLGFPAACGGGEREGFPPGPGEGPSAGRGGAAPSAGAGTFLGVAEEVLQGGGYTFVKVRRGKESVWVAGPGTDLKPGRRLAFLQGALLENFHSKSLGRTFGKIYFVSRFRPAGGERMGGVGGKKEKDVRISPPAVEERILSVARLRAAMKDLEGRVVRVRGKVIKVNAGILGRNWVHLADPDAGPGAPDLVFTTKDRVLEGAKVVVRGVVRLNRDFGYGYRYDLLLEDGAVLEGRE